MALLFIEQVSSVPYISMHLHRTSCAFVYIENTEWRFQCNILTSLSADTWYDIIFTYQEYKLINTNSWTIWGLPKLDYWDEQTANLQSWGLLFDILLTLHMFYKAYRLCYLKTVYHLVWSRFCPCPGALTHSDWIFLSRFAANIWLIWYYLECHCKSFSQMEIDALLREDFNSKDRNQI